MLGTRRPSRTVAARVLALLVATGLTSGCVAAAIPVVAGAAMGAKQVRGEQAEPVVPPRRDRLAQRAAMSQQRIELLPPGSSLPPPGGFAPARPAGGGAITTPGETAALRTQALLGLENYIELRIRYLRDKATAKSVIPSPGSTAATPIFDACGKRPVAVLFDADVLTDAYLAATAIRVRAQGVALLFDTPRADAGPATTAAALDRLGLWSSETADSLWLPQAGDPAGNDARRARIAARYCVVGMVGDRVTDFSDLFGAPDAAGSRALAALWGAGWFLLPSAR